MTWLYQYYVGHRPLSEVCVIYKYVTFLELVLLSSSSDDCHYTDRFCWYCFYFKISDDGWDQTQDLLNRSEI